MPTTRSTSKRTESQAMQSENATPQREMQASHSKTQAEAMESKAKAVVEQSFHDAELSTKQRELKMLRLHHSSQQRKLEKLVEDVTTSPVNATTYNVKYSYLQDLKAKQTEIFEKIVALDPIDIENDFSDDEACACMYMKLDTMIANGTPIAAPTAVTPVVSSSLHHLNISMPTFDGTYEQWPKFKAMFLDIVKESSASDVVKLHHLNKALIGKASGVLNASLIAGNNFASAWQLLEDRFENPRVIVDRHICYLLFIGLLQMKPVVKESERGLRELLECCRTHVDGLSYMKKEVDGTSELIITHILTSCFDPETRKLWERTMNRGEFPKLKTTLEFLCRQCEVLDQCASERGERGDKGKMVSAKVYTASIQNCKLCNDDQHNIVHCPEFLALSTRERQIKAQELRLCYNCLGAGHSSRRCESRRICRRCNKHHHTLLHFEQSVELPSSEHVATASHQEEETSGTGSSSSSSPSSPQIVLSVQGAAKSTVLLSTVLLNIVDDQGTNHQALALLDSGAQSNFISGRLVQLLRLPRKIVNIPLSGIGGSSTINVRHSVRATIRSRCSEDAFTLDMLVLATPSASLPTQPVDISSWNISEDYILADPTFNQPGRVDIILGAELFYEFLKERRVSFGLHRPVLQESKFGWIVSGNALIESASDPVVCATALITDNLSMVAAEDNAEMSLSHHPVISNAVIRHRSDLQSGLRNGVIEIQNDELRVGRAKREGASVADVICSKSSGRAAETSTSDSTAVCLGGSDFGGIISATGIPRNHDWKLWARLGTLGTIGNITIIDT